MKKITLALAIVFLMSLVLSFTARAEDLTLNSPTIKWENKVLYVSADGDCYAVKKDGKAFPAHTEASVSGTFVLYRLEGELIWNKVTMDMVTIIPCLFTPDNAEPAKSEKPTDPSTIYVPAKKEDHAQKLGWIIGGFDPGSAIINVEVERQLSALASDLKADSAMVAAITPSVSKEPYPVATCWVSNSTAPFFYQTGDLPVSHEGFNAVRGELIPIRGRDGKVKYDNLTCEDLLAKARGKMAEKILREKYRIPDYQTWVPENVSTTLNVAGPDILNRGVLVYKLSASEKKAGTNTVIIHVPCEECSNKEATVYMVVVTVEAPQSAPANTSTTLPPAQPAPQYTPAPSYSPVPKQHWCFGAKEDLGCYILDFGLIGAGVGYAVSQVTVEADGGKSSDGSKGGDAKVSICGDNDLVCVGAGLAAGMAVGWGVHELHDLAYTHKTQKSEKNKAKIGFSAMPTKGGGAVAMNVKF